MVGVLSYARSLGRHPSFVEASMSATAAEPAAPPASEPYLLHSALQFPAKTPGGRPCEVTLYSHCLVWRRTIEDGTEQEGVLPMDDVIGVSGDTYDQTVFVVHCLRKSGSTRCRTVYAFGCERVLTARCWIRHIRALLNGIGPDEAIPPLPHVLLLLNPFGGAGLARATVKDVVLPIFRVAELDVEVIETEYMGHARVLVRELNLANWDGIVCASGDGIINEVYNGLVDRNDWMTAIEMPVGVIPCGSGNALAHSIGAHDPVLACHIIIKGVPKPLDVFSVCQGDTRFFCVCLVEWAIIADVDHDSEVYRWMGGFRFDFVGALKVLKRKVYRGTLRYKEAVPPRADYQHSRCTGRVDCPQCFSASATALAHKTSSSTAAELSAQKRRVKASAASGSGSLGSPTGGSSPLFGSSGSLPLPPPSLTGEAGLASSSSLSSSTLVASSGGGASGGLPPPSPRGGNAGLTSATSSSSSPTSPRSLTSPLPGSSSSGPSSSASMAAVTVVPQHGKPTSTTSSSATTAATPTSNSSSSSSSSSTSSSLSASSASMSAPSPLGRTASGAGLASPARYRPLSTSSSSPLASIGGVEVIPYLLPIIGRPLAFPNGPPPSLSASAALSPEGPSGGDWHTIQGDFLFFLASNVAYQAASFQCTPWAHMADGTIDLCVVQEGTRMELINLMGKLSDGTHTNEPHVQYIKCTEFVLDPEPSPGSVVSVDGEFIDYAAFSVTVHPGLARLLCLP